MFGFGLLKTSLLSIGATGGYGLCRCRQISFVVFFNSLLLASAGSAGATSTTVTVDESAQLRETVLHHSTLLQKLTVLSRIERHRHKWDYWPLEEALREVLGTPGAKFILNGKIYHTSRFSDLKIVEDPLGEYFRITRTDTYSAKDIFLDRQLKPVMSGNESPHEILNLTTGQQVLEGQFMERRLAEPKTHFSSIPKEQISALMQAKQDLLTEFEIIQSNEKWKHVRPFLQERDPWLRVDILKSLHWELLSVEEKNFLLSYSRETNLSFDIEALRAIARESNDPAWYQVYADWFNAWSITNSHPSNAWQLQFLHELFPLLRAFEAKTNKLASGLGKSLARQMAAGKVADPESETPEALQKRTWQIHKFRDFAKAKRVILNLNQLEISPSVDFWRQTSRLPWPHLTEETKTDLVTFASLDLDAEAHPLILELAMQTGDSLWQPVLNKLILQGYTPTAAKGPSAAFQCVRVLED